MSPLTRLIVASLAFLAAHFVSSTPLRLHPVLFGVRPLV